MTTLEIVAGSSPASPDTTNVVNPITGQSLATLPHAATQAYAPYGTAGCIAATFDRTLPTSITAAAATSGTLRLHRIVIPAAGLSIGHITFWTGSTAISGGTHQWFGLFDNNRNVLGLTTDDTSNAWAANSVKTLAMAAPFVTTYAGLYYVGILITVSTTMPTIEASVAGQATGARNTAPLLSGDSTVGLTNPASCTGQQTAITTLTQIAYAELSN